MEKLMATRYHHAQRGILMVVVMLLAAVVSAACGYFTPPPSQQWLLWVFAIGFVMLAWLFSSLVVEVTENEFCWHFGPGIWTYRVPLSDIDNVQVVRNKLWNGFGIRMRPGFRLFNVSGFDAVELRLKTGDICRIGTDDAQGLAAALKS
jgi:hypothetical protein